MSPVFALRRRGRPIRRNRMRAVSWTDVAIAKELLSLGQQLRSIAICLRVPTTDLDVALWNGLGVQSQEHAV